MDNYDLRKTLERLTALAGPQANLEEMIRSAALALIVIAKELAEANEGLRVLSLDLQSMRGHRHGF
jgi:hypothetical protein